MVYVIEFFEKLTDERRDFGVIESKIRTRNVGIRLDAC